MRKIIVIVSFLITGKLLLAQELSGLAISMTLNDDSLFALDPWQIGIEVKNKTMNPVRVYLLRTNQGFMNKLGFLDIEFTLNNDTIWKSTGQIYNCFDNLGCTIGSGNSVDDYSIELSPGQIIRDNYNLMPVLSLKPGSFVKIRAVYASKNLLLHSPIQTIYLKPYGKKDNAAYQYLKTLPRPSFLLRPFCAVPYDMSDIEHAEYLLKTFPNSGFALYCNLFLAQTYSGLANAAASKKDLIQVISFSKKSKFHCLVVLKSDEPKFVEKGEAILTQMLNAYYLNFDFDTPIPEMEEFTYPPKN